MIPTAMSEAETRFLQATTAGKVVVEAGALLGHTTVAMAQAGALVTSIDLHEGYPQSKPRSTLSAFERNLRRYQVKARVETIIGDALSLLPQFVSDLAMIDLDGTRETTEAAMRASRAHHLLVHDAGRQNCWGVGEALRALKADVIEGVGTLVLVKLR